MSNKSVSCQGTPKGMAQMMVANNVPELMQWSAIRWVHI